MPSSNNKPPILSLRSTVLVLCALLVGLTAGGLTYVICAAVKLFNLEPEPTERASS
jgi:hypothetical protein